jgi:hypothetical protein
MAKWHEKSNPDIVFQHIKKLTRNPGWEKFLYKPTNFTKHTTVVNRMIVLDNEIPEFDKRILIEKAVGVANKGNYTKDSLIREIKKLETKYLLKPSIKFRLFSSISISTWCKIPICRFNGSTIIVNAKWKQESIRSRNDLHLDAQRQIVPEIPSNYVPVSVSVSARSENDAVIKAMDRLDFIRGIWNLHLNYLRVRYTIHGKRAPVNKIILGPYHTLHYPNGSISSKRWWYELNYQNPIKLYNKPATIKKMNQFVLDIRSLLTKSEYKTDIIRAVIMYVRALDTTDWNNSFLQLWSVLEFITFTKKAPYKVTIKRASFIHYDREYNKEVLMQLKEYRNESVHTGSTSNDIESYLYELKSTVELIIVFLIKNEYQFSSLEEVASFMDVPSDKNYIDSEIRKLQNVKKFIAY